jgi:hypothetical protein
MELNMKISFEWLLPGLVAALPMAASAQSNDQQYCAALSGKYERYLDQQIRNSAQPQNIQARMAIEKCKAGDAVAAIPALERALLAAKLDLPPRT